MPAYDLHTGSCVDVLPTLPVDLKFDLVLTDPPYP